jgi:hypothetical protein
VTRTGPSGRRRERLERSAPLDEGCAAKVAPARGEDVERHEAGRSLAPEPHDARRGGVQARHDRREVERAVREDDDLAVERHGVVAKRADPLHELWEVARERAVVSASDVDLVAVTEASARNPSHFGSYR